MVKYISMACGENDVVLVTSTIGVALRAQVEPLFAPEVLPSSMTLGTAIKWNS